MTARETESSEIADLRDEVARMQVRLDGTVRAALYAYVSLVQSMSSQKTSSPEIWEALRHMSEALDVAMEIEKDGADAD